MRSISSSTPMPREFKWAPVSNAWRLKFLFRNAPVRSKICISREGSRNRGSHPGRRMALTKFNDLMHEAERGQYAVGYFESWDLESLQAVADAAEATRSPVLLGFSGIYLPHPERRTHERLGVYAALGNEMCRQISVPACLLFNESPHLERVMEAIDLNFGIVMYSDDNDQMRERVRQVVTHAHKNGVAVEGEMTALPGV